MSLVQRGRFQRLVIKNTANATGWSYAVYERLGAVPSVFGQSAPNDETSLLNANGVVTNPNAPAVQNPSSFLIFDTKTSSTAEARNFNLDAPFWCQDPLKLDQRDFLLYLYINTAGTYIVGYTADLY